jgi:predicted TIM-barrel fold metal-dependent hydrolase
MAAETSDVREIRVGAEYDTREQLANAERQARKRGFDKFLIVDADAHHYETESWQEITNYIEDPVLRQEGRGGVMRLIGGVPLLPGQVGNQDLSGRVVRYGLRNLEKWQDDGDQRDTVIVKRAMRAMGIDYQIVFPTPMLNLGLHPVPSVEVGLARAYARWMSERLLAGNPEIKTMLYLPFGDPKECLRIIEDFGDLPGVVGFMVTSVRHRPVWDEEYVPLYDAIQETGKPLGFHAAFNWIGDRTMESLNRFLSVHAIGFPLYNMIHLTNWIVNGIPERFPRLKVLWIESGLAWLPFLMQRLDHEYVMRPSEAPLLKRKPSEYVRDMFFTTQPLEVYDDLDVLEMTVKMLDGENKLLYASDYPHWDFDTPARIYDLPFLSEQGRRNILGSNAAGLFGLHDHVAAAQADGTPVAIDGLPTQIDVDQGAGPVNPA